MGLLDLFKRSRPEAPAAKPERNEPCWCGSGKKYKKCHLAVDEKEQQAKAACSLTCGPG